MQTETTNELELNQNDQQPSDAVAAELETNSNADAQPQGAEEESTLGELDFGDGAEVAGVSTENDENGEEAKQKAIKQAAWKARQKKREEREAEAIAKAKQEKADADAKAKLEAEQAEMRAYYQEAKRGAKPEISDFEDSDEYDKALIAWHNAAPAKPQEQEQAPQVDVEQIKQQVAIESAMSEGVEELKSEISEASFNRAMTESNSFFESKGVDPKAIGNNLAYLANISDGSFNPAKVQAVLASKPAQKAWMDAYESGQFTNEYKAINFLTNLQKKFYKISKPKGVQTSPIPETTASSGSVSASVEAARNKWIKDPTVQNFQAYKNAKGSQS